VSLSDGELDALVLANGPSEDHPLLRSRHRALDEPAAVAHALGGDQDAFGVHAVQDVAEAATLFTNQRGGGNAQIGELEFAGGVVQPGLDGAEGQAVF
jgi:hypothetical protein